MIAFIQALRRMLLKVETGILVISFIVILLLAITQILLRNFFDMGIIWADSFLRLSVLWLGMMGALIASRNDHHININLGQKYVPQKALRYIKAVVFLFTASVCLIVSWFGLNLVLLEQEEAGLAFAQVPSWITVSIIPLAFMLMGLRYLTLTALAALNHPIEEQQKMNEQA